MSYRKLTAAILASLSCATFAADDIDAPTVANAQINSFIALPFYLDPVTIIGDPEKLQQVTGAAYLITDEDLQRFEFSDVNRALRQVPGVSLQIEDGYALRPNISIRGTASERSSRITLLEDNVLIAPAPYSAPSAYYFPTFGRMNGVEVLKGPSAITQGPYTVGGAINFLSTPIPSDRAGMLLTEFGSNDTIRVHGWYGEDDGQFGWLAETHQWRSDGYQTIDNSNSATGLSKEDWMVKLRFGSDPNSNTQHQFNLKLQYAAEDSEQSYLGLTDSDLNASPYRRYSASQLDNISTEHNQVIARYAVEFSNELRLSATAYHNDHKRNWFKTEGIDVDGSSDAGSFSRTSWFNVIQAVNLGESLGGLNPAEWQAILDGGDTLPGSIQVRANNRSYLSQGIQLGFDKPLGNDNVRHLLTGGIRFHQDEEDRLQRNSTYHMQSGTLVLDDIGLNGNAGNRLQEADAIAVWLHDTITFGDWTLTPGLRYETMDQKRTRWEIRPGQTDDPSSRAADNLRDTRENDTDVLIPGFGALYQVNQQWSVLGGVHKGFTAPTNSPGVREEESINYEAGFRFRGDRISSDVIGFYTDYDNLLGVCTNSSGGDCEIGDAFNGDAASILGLEVLFATDMSSSGHYAMPLQISYTYMDASFDSDIADTDFFGTVSKGDPLPYVPDHQLYAMAGWEGQQFSSYLSGTYTDAVCVKASCGPFEQTDSSVVFDLAAHYQLTPRVNVYGLIDNIFDATDIAGRHPYGARPNKDRTYTLGLRVDL